MPLPPQTDPPSFSNDDQVYLFAGRGVSAGDTRWTPRFRSVLGVRDDYQHGTDIDYLAALHEIGRAIPMAARRAKSLPQPKGSLIYTRDDSLEFYLSAGEGFTAPTFAGESGHERRPGITAHAAAREAGGQEIGVRAAPSTAILL